MGNGAIYHLYMYIIMYICKGFVRFQPLAKDADVEQVGRSRIKKQGGGVPFSLVRTPHPIVSNYDQFIRSSDFPPI